MKRIFDEGLLAGYLEKYQIADLFETGNLPFFMLSYDVGETIISPLETTAYLQFVVKGEVLIYAIRQNGSQYTLSNSADFTLLGDVEFVTYQKPDFFAEANTEVLTVALSLAEYQESLKKDTVFLNYLLWSLAKKVQMISVGEAEFVSLEEKVLHYMTYHCPHQRLVNIGKTAVYFHCSRRQLQRVLKQMCEKGVIMKQNKGIYVLNQ